MKIDVSNIRGCLKSFDFKTLFLEHLGWDKHHATLDLTIGGSTYQLTAVAQKRGFVAYLCPSIHDRATRLKIDHQATKSSREHFVVYTDKANGQQVWHWVRREPGKPLASRDHRFDAKQTGDALIQRLERIAIDLDEEDKLDIVEVAGRARAAFDVDKVTKKFFDRFKAEHAGFQKFIKGIKAEPDLQWYTSLMLNRLMFVYFIQKKGFLDGDTDYLRNRLARVREIKGRDKFQTFYRYFLRHLFHEGLGKSPEDRQLDAAMKKLLGKVPYLNGGFFEEHELEIKYPKSHIPDNAFEKLFDFFDQYSWHLDERPLHADNEINPDVVGYIFEKYINQKQMGAYYTKEDITEYISKNTIIPFLFDAAQKQCAVAFKPKSALWRLLQDDPDRYIYSAMRHGVIDEAGGVIPLPDSIAAGIADVAARGDWNKRAAEPFGLPTETWREHIVRRQRCLEVREKLRSGEVAEAGINELITLNLDLWQFARDVIVNAEGPELVRAFWESLRSLTVLDPTCGSGAFLFAALRILESLYDDCLERMARFIDDAASASAASKKKQTKAQRAAYDDFRQTLDGIDAHPSHAYFILKSIIINNLFGVDIMAEAVEICKLRLFLKLVAQVDAPDQIEPLPDIDFNIRAGNTLVGYATLDQVRQAVEGGKGKNQAFDFGGEVEEIEQQAGAVDLIYRKFRAMQTSVEPTSKQVAVTKRALRGKLTELSDRLDRHLAGEYGVNADKPKAFDAWKSSHQPFHWLVEFYGIMSSGGFDVVIGNPPYLATTKVSYLSEDSRNLRLPDLYAHVLLQSIIIAHSNAKYGMIVPLSLSFSRDFSSLRSTLASNGTSWFSSYDNIPAALFAGVSQRCTIWIGNCSGTDVLVTPMYRWRSAARAHVISNIAYTELADTHDAALGLPKLPNQPCYDLIKQVQSENTLLRSLFEPTKNVGCSLGFSPSARNFVSAFHEPPPCLDDRTLQPVDASTYGVLSLVDSDCVQAAVAALSGEVFFSHWLFWGDGFHVTNGNVSTFLSLLEIVPESHYRLICELGEILTDRKYEALVFKRNAKKYVGNYNYRGHAWLTRRVDMLLLSGLNIQRDSVLNLLDHVQQVLSINEFAGEKSIPVSVKSKFRPKVPNASTELDVLTRTDKLLQKKLRFSKKELEYLVSSDVAFQSTTEGSA